MGKIAKVKKREVSFRSRAARRGASPAAEVTVKAPVEETDYKPWVHSAQNAGISKKKKTKQLTRAQRARHLKGLEFGERNVDKLERKLANSKARARRVDERRAGWEELNGEVFNLAGKQESKTAGAILAPSKLEKPAKASQTMEDVQIDESENANPKTSLDETESSHEQPVAAETAGDELDEIT